MHIYSSPATLTGAEEKKTRPSRFIIDFLTGIFDGNHSMFTARAVDYPLPGGIGLACMEYLQKPLF
jgi:hypothetical protein